MRVRLAVVAVVVARLAMACVDGVTPDCSNPSVCAPSEGDAAATPATSDAAPDTSSPANDAGSDVVSTPVDAADAADDGG